MSQYTSLTEKPRSRAHRTQVQTHKTRARLTKAARREITGPSIASTQNRHVSRAARSDITKINSPTRLANQSVPHHRHVPGQYPYTHNPNVNSKLTASQRSRRISTLRLQSECLVSQDSRPGYTSLPLLHTALPLLRACYTYVRERLTLARNQKRRGAAPRRYYCPGAGIYARRR